MTQINPELPCHPQILSPHMPLWDLFRELKFNKSWTVSQAAGPVTANIVM